MNAQVAQRIGQGTKKVMVIHGWFGPSVYDGFFQDFDLNAYEFAIVHNPGYGVAKGSAPSADMTALANSLFELADQLGWEKFQVIGHSYGGAAGLRMASLHPERITSLAGIAPVMPLIGKNLRNGQKLCPTPCEIRFTTGHISNCGVHSGSKRY